MNKVILCGNIANDIDYKVTSSGTAVCKFSLATNDWNGTEKKPNFHRVTIFGKQAEITQQYLSKGKQLLIEGTIAYGSYQNKDGNTVYTTDIIARNIEFVGGAARNSEANQEGDSKAPPENNFQSDDIPF